MPASALLTRRRVLLGLAVIVLAIAAVIAVVTLRPAADPVAGATTSASPSSSSGAEGERDSEPGPSGKGDKDDAGDAEEPDPASSDGEADESEPDGAADKASAAKPREVLDPRPFDAAATPEPGVTVTVPSVKKVTGEANVPGEVGGPALRFTVELTNGTGKTLDLRTVVVNAYYGSDRTPAAPLLKPGGKAFEAEVGVDGSARGAFVFNVPAEFQDEVELEVDPGVGAAIVIFTGA